MSVTFDNSTTITGASVSSLTTGAFTITSQANRCAILGYESDGNPASPTCSVGATSGVWVPGTFALVPHTFYAVNPPSGSQTATVNFTNVGLNNALAVATYYGVNQTTPVSNGKTSGLQSNQTSSSLTISSNVGDMSVDHCYIDHGQASAPTQTQTWSANIGGATGAGTNSSRGAGAASNTHTWTTTQDVNQHVIHDGCNLVADTATILGIYT